MSQGRHAEVHQSSACITGNAATRTPPRRCPTLLPHARSRTWRSPSSKAPRYRTCGATRSAAVCAAHRSSFSAPTVLARASTLMTQGEPWGQGPRGEQYLWCWCLRRWLHDPAAARACRCRAGCQWLVRGHDHHPPPFPRRYWRYSHGTTWAQLADDLLVVDVPGDHFSLLRQEPADMEPLVGLPWLQSPLTCSLAALQPRAGIGCARGPGLCQKVHMTACLTWAYACLGPAPRWQCSR